ncbi:MAG: serine protease [Gallionellaceae bacterium]|nr:serine protease [Gallionellaceae bacterium]
MTGKILPLLYLLLCGLAARADEPDWATRVYPLLATRADGATELGSAVALGGDRLVTNCHVLQGAGRIEVQVGGTARQARADRRDAYRDLCFLSLSGLRAPALAEGEARVGLEVVAVGYPGGRFALGKGRIIGLHSCACSGGKVIQTSAPFDHGASGGGLFDRQGRLVGILSFKARSGGNFHFALPVAWLRQDDADDGMPAATGEVSFWAQPGRESGYFLAACDLGARQDWRQLAPLAREWTGQEPGNPEAWMALGRAERGLGQGEAAATAFQRTLALDSRHAEARLALQQLEFDLRRDLLPPAGL